MTSKVDLHMHSVYSDGSDTPEQLIQNLQTTGIHTFALTDHDTVGGIPVISGLVPDTMTFFPGIEFSCKDPAGRCHILGYGYDPEAPAFREVIREGHEKRIRKMEKRVKFLDDQFHIHFTEEEMRYLRSQNSGGKPHLGRLLVKKGIAEDLDSAIYDYIDLCPTMESKIEAEKAIRAILQAGGIPVWAHSLSGEGHDHLTEDEFIDEFEILRGYGLLGLECFYSAYDKKQVAFLLHEAKRHHMLISGGSDYHGTVKKVQLGTLNSFGQEVDPEELTLIRELERRAAARKKFA